MSRQRRAVPNGGYLYPEEAQYANASESGMIIEDLVLYQWYTLRLAAMTSKGPGPTFDLNVSCAQAGMTKFNIFLQARNSVQNPFRLLSVLPNHFSSNLQLIFFFF